MKSKFLIALVIGLIGFSSCDTKPYYDKTYSFKDKTWDQRNKPEFEVPIVDTNQWYDFIITIRTTTDYKFSNLWIYLNTTTPTKLSGREPYQIRIANDDGTWAGSKTGTIIENQLLFKRRKFPELGKYKFVVEHGITEKSVDEILDIGLRIVPVK
ncbi:MAG: gliding motility lipoprotein GldH [Bacteroidota bacterium]